MSTGDVLYVVGAPLAVLLIASAPTAVGIRGAGPRYRAGLVRMLAAGWLVAAAAGGWMVLGWYAIKAGPGWMRPYAYVTWAGMLVGAAVLPFAIRATNRRLAAARAADARGGPATGLVSAGGRP